MADDRDNPEDLGPEFETEAPFQDEETRVYEVEPLVKDYTIDEAVEREASRRWMSVLLGALAFSLVLVAGLALYFVLGRDGGGGLIPVSPTINLSDPSWERVRTSGRLVVGTSLDYPPFSFRNEQFQPDGFDIALIREVANRLGVTAEITDMAFDSLFAGLNAGQIDVAIGAISITDERQELVDFGEVYYVGEEGILARADSTISSVTTLSNMTGLRVGVQRGSVYETWLQRDLVDSAITAAGNLFVYETVDAAVRDLREQRLDLVVLDRRPAEADVARGGVKLVGRGLYPQRYAIAVRRGANALRSQVNAALGQLSTDRRIAQLAQQYLNVDPGDIITPPQSTPTTPGQPTAAPIPTTTACADGMHFVADLSLDDNNMQSPPPISPGQAFIKGWRVQNSGTCAWTTAYRLVFVSGNVSGAGMGGQPTSVQGFVPAGQQYDIYVNLVAPLTSGVYQGIWQMVDDQNQPFGDRIWVGITVPAVSTATPPPTQTPSPSIEFTVDRTNILQGECVTFRWNVQNARAAYFYAQGEAWQNNQVTPQGNRVACPSTSTTYYLRVQKNDGTVEERQIAVTVRPNVNAPVIAQFVATPPQVTVGQCVQLQWDVQGSVTRVTVSNQFRVIWDNAPSRGNTQDCTGAPTVVEYKLQATGPGGTSQALDYVTVVSAVTATPVSTAPPSVPIIDSFSVLPSQIKVGQCVQINWSAGGGTWLVRLLRNNVLVLDKADLVGSAQDCLQNPGTVVYQLVASTAGGQSVSRDQSVLVTESQPTNPLAGKDFTAVAVNNSPVIVGTTIVLTFSADGQVNGSSGCNTYNGRYSVSGDASSGLVGISGLSSSMNFCSDPPGVMDQEQAYWNALRAAVSYTIGADGLLILRNAAREEVLRFLPRPR